MTHRPLLLFCYERGEPCRQNIDQVSKDSMSKHNTFTVHLLRKRVNLRQCCNSRNSTQEGFCLFVFLLRADIKTLKLAAEPCDRLTVLDWDFVLYVKVLCCNCGKHEPPPEAHPSGWISISCEQLFMRQFWTKPFLFQEYNLQYPSLFICTAINPQRKPLHSKLYLGGSHWGIFKGGFSIPS